MRRKKKKKVWYKNPYKRFLALCGILAAMIIILVVVINGSRSGEETAVSSAAPSAAASVGSGGETAVPVLDVSSAQAQNPETVSESPAPVQNPEAVSEAPAPETPEAVQPSVPEGAVPAQNEDGTGAAGITAMGEDLLASSAETGWHFNDYYTWYSTSPGYCYANGWQDIDGLTYHFDAAGHLDLGWKLIGGTPCYFDDSGVYQPGADNSKLLAFTFDDGPSEGTDALLDLCSQTGARVTFFMIGRQVEDGGAVIPYILKYRCQLGNHSYTHSDMYKKTVEECVEDFAKCDELIRQYSGGIGADVIRFPYGDLTDEQVAAIGKASIFWDVDTFDWQTRDVESIKQEVYSTISEGNLILMHDRYEESVEACRQLFPELIAQGYQLVTVSELAAAKGIDLANAGGITYYNFRG